MVGSQTAFEIPMPRRRRVHEQPERKVKPPATDTSTRPVFVSDPRRASSILGSAPRTAALRTRVQ
jgi:hypothetical protein